MRNWLASVWFSSILILTSLTLPFCARTAFSSNGVSCLHGPHQGAQKSTSTGTVREASITSLAKVAVVASLMTSLPPAAGFVAFGLPKPNTMVVSKPVVGMLGLLRVAIAPLPGLRNGHDAWLVAAGSDEGYEVLARDVGRRRVLQRVVVEPLVAH